ncbi:MAG: hypothetical protein ACE5DM_00575 [Candidatus Nanoarchaeia archaeon]
MKSLVVYLILLILLASAASATEIFDGTIKEETNTDIGGKVVYAKYYEASGKISLHVIDDDKYLLLGEAECESIGLWEYCYDGSTADEEEYTTQFGETLLKEFYNVDIHVNHQAPSISIDMSTESTGVSIDQRFNLKITLSNTGDLDASNVYFELPIPDGLEVTMSGMGIVGNKLTWSGTIRKGKSKELEASLEGKEYGKYTLTGKAEYDQAGNTAEEDADLELEVKFPYTLEAELSPKLVGKNEAAWYTVTITNDDESVLDLNKLEFIFPSALDIKSVPSGFSITQNTLSGDDQISAGQSKDYAVKIQSNRQGEYKIKTDAEIRVGQRTFTETIDETLGVAVSGIVPIINITPENPKSYDSIRIDIYLENRDENNATTKPKVTSDLFMPANIDEATYAADFSTMILTKTITAPQLDEAKEYYVKVSGGYMNERGIDFEYETKADFTIDPAQKLVKVTQESVVDGKTVEVTVFVENLKGSTLEDMDIFSLLPKGFKVAGDQSTRETFTAFEKKQVLNYTVTIPDEFNDDFFLIENTVNAEEDGKLQIQESNLRVDLRGVKQEVKSDEIQKENIDEAKNKTELNESVQGILDVSVEKENPGVIKRMWNWFRCIFGCKKRVET